MCGKRNVDGQQIGERVKIVEEKLSMALLFKIMSDEMMRVCLSMAKKEGTAKTGVAEKTDENRQPGFI
jgi:hypothetical protein